MLHCLLAQREYLLVLQEGWGQGSLLRWAMKPPPPSSRVKLRQKKEQLCGNAPYFPSGLAGKLQVVLTGRIVELTKTRALLFIKRFTKKY